MVKGLAIELREMRPAVAGPRLMKLYQTMRRRRRGLTFVAFVRMIDPSVPLHKADYLRHRTYMACDYMRRRSKL